MTVAPCFTSCIHPGRVKGALVQPKRYGVRVTMNMFVKGEHHVSSRDEVLVIKLKAANGMLFILKWPF